MIMIWIHDPDTDSWWCFGSMIMILDTLEKEFKNWIFQKSFVLLFPICSIVSLLLARASPRLDTYKFWKKIVWQKSYLFEQEFFFNFSILPFSHSLIRFLFVWYWLILLVFCLVLANTLVAAMLVLAYLFL